MKKGLIRFIKFLMVIGIVAGTVYYCKHEKEVVVQTDVTLTKIYNGSQDSVLVYVTLGATPGCLQNIGAIPFITDSLPGQRGLQGTFVLAPGDSTIAYAPDSLGYNGVISFKFAPDNCATPAYPNGINQFEFMINNAFQGANAQESINISCVHGVNCVIRVDVVTLNNFNAGPTVPVIQSFANTLDRSQIGIAGIYPFGCDTCTGSKNPPICIQLPQPAQKASICQVQRNAAQSGGLIKVIYLGREQPALK
jgi:hypothetical protein